MAENNFNEEKNDKKPEKKLCVTKNYSGFGVRHVQIGMLFLCVITGCAVSSCISVVILAMTDKKLHGDKIQTFDWDQQIQGLILSTAVWGDIPFQIVASLLVQKFGTKTIISFIMYATGILSLLMPLSAYKFGWVGICVNRFLQGVVQAFTFPSTHTLLGTWAPVVERNRFGNFVYSGIYMSLITTMPLSAWISSSSLGWPWVFYVLGGVVILCGILWSLYGAESPAHHKTISAEERDFIQSSLGNDDILNRKLKTPWKAILTSKPVWALILTQAGAVWLVTIMTLETPAFIKMALGVDLQNSGLLSALPYAVTWCILQVTSFAADYLVTKEYFTLTGIRKLMNTLGTWGPALFLLLLPFVPASNVWLSITFIVFIISLDGISSFGFLLNHIDLSPNFAGILVSLCNTASSGVCLLAPILSGYILQDPTDTEQWKIIFFITAALTFLGNCAFLLYGSGEIQPFNMSYTLQNTTDAENADEIKECVT